MQITGNNLLAMAVLVFIAVLLASEALYLVWRSRHGRQARKLKDRLETVRTGADAGSKEARVLKQRLAHEDDVLERLAHGLPGAAGLATLLTQSGLTWSVGGVVARMGAAAAAVLFTASALLNQPTAIALTAAAVAGVLPVLYVSWRRGKRLRKLEQQLPEALDLMTRGLRAGHAFSSTLKMAGEELPEPIGAEFRAVHEEIHFGFSLQQALGNLAQRIPSTDVRYFVVAVLIQRESGGNLTEILGNLSRLVRERLKLMARVRVLSADGRLSAWILGVMPFALAALMNAFNPAFMSPLWTDPIGVTMLQVMLTVMAVGVLMMRKIVRIRV